MRLCRRLVFVNLLSKEMGNFVSLSLREQLFSWVWWSKMTEIRFLRSDWYVLYVVAIFISSFFEGASSKGTGSTLQLCWHGRRTTEFSSFWFSFFKIWPITQLNQDPSKHHFFKRYFRRSSCHHGSTCGSTLDAMLGFCCTLLLYRHDTLNYSNF